MTGPGDTAAEQAAADARDAASVEALAQGGLPVTAQLRLEEMRSSGGAWTSDLSVSELTAVRSVGFEPVGLVMGSSIYHLGANFGSQWLGQFRGAFTNYYACPHGWAHEDMRMGYNWEHLQYEEGIMAARQLAMSRLEAEARALGAHGVAGVRLTLTGVEGQAGVMEFTVIGTALRRPGVAPLADPFTSHLSGQELAKLVSTGYVPCALVMAVAAIEVDPGCGTEYRMRAWDNVEIDQITDGAYQCRQLAVEHLEEEAEAAGAEGIVGVDVQFKVHELAGEAMLLEMRAIGTAVRKFAQEPMPAEPLVMLRLRDRVR
jgi:uncharacterized protein YbjQ (UPF0145 family)